MLQASGPSERPTGSGWECRLMAERRWRTEGKTLLMNSPPHPRERLWLDSGHQAEEVGRSHGGFTQPTESWLRTCWTQA